MVRRIALWRRKGGRRMSFRSILRGAGSIFELWPDNSARYRSVMATTASDALRRDWEKVGKDLWVAVSHVQKNKKNEDTVGHAPQR